MESASIQYNRTRGISKSTSVAGRQYASRHCRRTCIGIGSREIKDAGRGIGNDQRTGGARGSA